MRSLVLSLLIVPGLVLAQAPVTAGARVRIRDLTPGEVHREGTVKIAGADSAVVDLSPPRGGWGVVTSTLPYSRLDVAIGQRRRTVEGAGIGLLVGAVAGAAAGYAIIAEQGHYVPSAGAIAGSFFGAGAGVVMGARIGYKRRTDRWRPIVQTDGIGSLGLLSSR